MLEKLVDKNLLVFDSQADPGEFTARLISLMQTTYRRNTPNLNNVDIEDEDTPIDIFPVGYGWKCDTVYLPKHIAENRLHPAVRFANTLGLIVSAQEEDCLEKYYKLSATLASNDKFLVIMWDSSHDNGILGSF